MDSPPCTNPSFSSTLVVVLSVWGSREALAGIPDIACRINVFLDPVRLWSFERSVRRGHPRLAARIIRLHTSQLPDPAIRDIMCNDRISLAAREGDLRTVQTFVHYFPDLIVCRAPDEAALFGHLHVLDWLFDHSGLVCWDQCATENAVSGGHLSVLLWWDRRFVIQPSDSLLLQAIQCGHDAIVHWLWYAALSRNWSLSILKEAISVAPLSLAKWMIGVCDDMLTFSLDPAAARGHLSYLHWGASIGGTASPDAMDCAAAAGNFTVVRFLHKNNICGGSTNAMDGAAGNGHLRMLRWLRINRSEGCSSAAFIRAARGGHIPIMQWLFQHYSQFYHQATFAHAAGSGHLELVRWLSTHCSTSTDAMDWAAASGHLNVVAWLSSNRTEGCTTNAIDDASANGHLEVVKWLHLYRSEGCTPSALDGAAAGGHLPVVVWLHTNRAEGATTAAMDLAARRGNITIVRWLHTHRNEGCTTAAMDGAAFSGSLKLVKWFHHHRVEGCTVEAMDNAIQSGRTSIVLFLHNNRSEGCSARGFMHAVTGGYLHLARWLSQQYPEMCTSHTVDLGRVRRSWTPEIIHAAFPARPSI
ncbi:hypothetical protein F444_09004 [Phytophthora nicotianae P1976]|uniref:Uncharacterized protein n=1 Tax=Phytophthora nicotianae P1976 TaxID=1317066 RepID=A0A081A940_PHYNI|nr:hypothetical protein F444_09004 [Phytophthora nicotianae P1976]